MYGELGRHGDDDEEREEGRGDCCVSCYVWDDLCHLIRRACRMSACAVLRDARADMPRDEGLWNDVCACDYV